MKGVELEENSGEDEPGKIFVGGLSWETTQEKLNSYFSQYGDIGDCVIMKNNETGRSRGFGFVTFKDPNCVGKALCDGPHIVDDRTIDPKRCSTRVTSKGNKKNNFPKVFLGGLPPDCTETDIRAFFSRFGTVIEVVLMYDQEKKKPRGFGFLSFEKEESVKQVCAEHYVKINGKKVECKHAEPREKGGKNQQSSQQQPQQNQWGGGQNMAGPGGNWGPPPGPGGPMPGWQGWQGGWGPGPQQYGPQGNWGPQQGYGPGYQNWGPGYGPYGGPGPNYGQNYGYGPYGGYGGYSGPPAGGPQGGGTPGGPGSNGPAATGEGYGQGPPASMGPSGGSPAGPPGGTSGMSNYTQENSSYGPTRGYSGSGGGYSGSSGNYNSGSGGGYGGNDTNTSMGSSRSLGSSSGGGGGSNYHPYRR